MKATIKDVAMLANVATSTVSRVISNSPRISEKTKRRVREAMEELGYYPNFNARSLANKNTRTLGVVMPNSAKVAFQNPFFPEVIRGISMKAYEENYGLYLTTGQTEDEILAEVKNMVYGSRVDGIILLYSSVNDRVMPFLMEQNFPFVLIGRPYKIDEDRVTFVNNDNFKASKTVTEYLLLLGHKQIGFIGGNHDYVVSVDHMKGYEHALMNADIPIREDYFVNTEDLDHGEQDTIIELMSLDQRPTALIVPDDVLTFRVLKMLADMNVKVPDDISLVSFNNVMISELSSPMMTTVDIQIYNLGLEATNCLVEKINDPSMEERKVIVPHRLIKRETCKKLEELK